MGHRKALLQQRSDLLLTQPLAPARQRRAIEWRLVLEHHFPAKVLEVRVLFTANAPNLRADLPLAALAMAFSPRASGADLIHHSDRGAQYASADYRKVMQSAGFRASMSRKADCYDNAPTESFRHGLYQPDRDGAKSNLTLSIFSGRSLDLRWVPCRGR